MSEKTPQQVASEYKKDSPMMRAGAIKAFTLLLTIPGLPENVKKIVNDCIGIMSGVHDYNEKTAEIQAEPELPKPKEPTPIPSAKRRFRR